MAPISNEKIWEISQKQSRCDLNWGKAWDSKKQEIQNRREAKGIPKRI